MSLNPFAPLKNRLAPRSLGEGAAPADYVAPIPTWGVPGHPLGHPECGEIRRVYDYNDANGRMLFRVMRFEDEKGQKHYRPLTLWDLRNGHMNWKWQAPPSPRPLYGLDELAKRGPNAQVLIVEGEKAAKHARAFMKAYVVMTSMGGAKAAAHADWTVLAGRKVTIWPDADEAGRGYAQDVAACLAKAGAKEVRIVKLDRRFKDSWDLGDWGDTKVAQPVHNVSVLHRMIDEAPLAKGASPGSAGFQPALADSQPQKSRLEAGAPRPASLPSSDPCTPSSIIRTGISGATLQFKSFAPIKWIVPDVIVEGLTLVAGKPKLGKSWLALNLGLAVAAGGRAFSSTTCEQGDVLALTLEDNERRLQSRVRQMLGDAHWPEGITFHTDWPRLDEGGLGQIEEWVQTVAAPKLVIIDVWAKVRGRPDGKKTLYTDDFEQLAVLQRLASKHRVGIIVMHHASKRENPDDPFDLVSGTTGLTGAADSILILRKEAAQPDAVLYGRGRDLPVFEKALRFDGTRGLWAVLGDADEYRSTAFETKILKELERADEPLSPKDIAAILEGKESTAKGTLYRMARAGKVINLKGKFALLPTHVQGV
ncbi:MAG: AAA family ATPase [Micropepsaceae bacterium]